MVGRKRTMKRVNDVVLDPFESDIDKCAWDVVIQQNNYVNPKSKRFIRFSKAFVGKQTSGFRGSLAMIRSIQWANVKDPKSMNRFASSLLFPANVEAKIPFPYEVGSTIRCKLQ